MFKLENRNVEMCNLRMLLSGVGEGVNSEWVLSGWRATRMPQHFLARYVGSLIRDGSESNRGVEG
jgi:hypothetical protein